MDVRIALLTALALLPMSGCVSTWNCNPDNEDFTLDEPVSAAELDMIVADYGAESWEEVECESVCSATYREVRGWETGDVASCSLTLPENADGSGEAGRVTCEGSGLEYFCEGRRPLGHIEHHSEGERGVVLGRSLAAMAQLELASIYAFEQLATQLESFGAPAGLIARCRAAAEDERRHARWLTALAAQAGVEVCAPRAEAPVAEDRVSVALHNAVEGCVNESFAAMLATCRSQWSSSPILRRVFARIAADETRHGQLAWDLHAWLMGELDPHERARVESAQVLALAQLPGRARALARVPSGLGALGPAEAEALGAAFAQQLAA